ncbi:MAG: aromatic acid exporter family protein [Microbacteriaceae bacterium]
MAGGPDEFRRLERGIRRRLDARVALSRVADSVPAILQILVAVAAAYSFAHWVLGHAFPVLAVTVTISSLGFTRDTRPRRVAESVLGIMLGIALADGLSLLFGKGLWQLVFVLLVVFIVGRAISPNPAFAVAAAIPSALVVLLPDPTGGPFTRSLDALVGGVVALLVTALVPRDPRRAELRDGRLLFSVFGESVGSIVECLSVPAATAGELALGRLRRTQAMVDAWRVSHDTAFSIARISPFLRRFVPELHRHRRLLEAADLTARHLRHIARRSEFLVRDGVPRPALAAAVAEVGTGIRLLGAELDDPAQVGAARSLLADLARRLDPAVLMPDAGVAESSILILLRPLTVDLLVGTGMGVEHARDLLPKL